MLSGIHGSNKLAQLYNILSGIPGCNHWWREVFERQGS